MLIILVVLVKTSNSNLSKVRGADAVLSMRVLSSADAHSPYGICMHLASPGMVARPWVRVRVLSSLWFMPKLRMFDNDCGESKVGLG